MFLCDFGNHLTKTAGIAENRLKQNSCVAEESGASVAINTGTMVKSRLASWKFFKSSA